MSLDQNLFTLSLAASTEEPTALDLTDPSTNTIHYRKRRHPDQEKEEIAYAWGMYGEPVSSPVPSGKLGAHCRMASIWAHSRSPVRVVTRNYNCF
jgi:hypothetical protein